MILESCQTKPKSLVATDHRRIKRQKGRQRSSLIFWLFDAARGGGRGYCETKFLAVLGIRIQIRIRKDPNVLRDPNPIKPFRFGSGSKRIRIKILHSKTLDSMILRYNSTFIEWKLAWKITENSTSVKMINTFLGRNLSPNDWHFDQH